MAERCTRYLRRPDFLDRILIVEFLEMKPEMRRDEGSSAANSRRRDRESWVLLDAITAGF